MQLSWLSFGVSILASVIAWLLTLRVSDSLKLKSKWLHLVLILALFGIAWLGLMLIRQTSDRSSSFGSEIKTSNEATARTLWLFNPEVDRDTRRVVLNGIDTAQPATPFRFEWGDGTASIGFFPQTKVYAEGRNFYAIRVVATYSNGSHDYATITVRLP